MIRFYQLLFCLVLISCSQKPTDDNKCEIDFEFKSNFQNCINIIAARQSGVYTGEPTYDAYYCLSSLTNYKSLMDMDSDTPLSYPYSDTINYFCQDLEAWMKWYDQNKCDMTMQKALTSLKDQKWPTPFEEYSKQGLDCVLHLVKEHK
jgi:hypothetical protein